MRFHLFWLAASIVFQATFVNGTVNAPKAGFTNLIHRVEDQGAAIVMDAGRAKFLGIGTGRNGKVQEFTSDEDATDGLDHSCEVYRSSDSARVEAIVMRSATFSSPQQGEAYYFLFSASGVLARAVLGHTIFEDGKVVRGSGHADLLPVDSAVVRRKVRHELDFWLKGKYRKKKRAAK